MDNAVGSLTQYQLSIIIGSILGDGYIRRIEGRKDAFLEFNPKVWEVPQLTVDEHGRVDFRRVSFIKKVKHGEWIIKKHPPTPGKNGKNLFGKIIKTKNGKNIIFKYDNSITTGIGERKQLIYYAAKNGHVVFDGFHLTVEDCLVIQGDVDYSTGNIDYDGFVIVKGNVLDDFEVKALKGVDIEGNIYKAKVVSNGIINVQKGIIGGEIESETKVMAHFIENAKIICSGPVIINSEIIHSQIFSGDTIICDVKHGKIVGGHLIAYNSIICKIIGSPYGVKTKFELGTHFFAVLMQKKLLLKIKELKEKLKKMAFIKKRIEKIIQENNLNSEVTSDDIKERLAKLMLNEISCKKQLVFLLKKAKQLESSKKLNIQAYLQINQIAHPPFEVSIAEKSKTFFQELKFSKIFYSIEKNEIEVK
jgi:uncharacterized protein (DUF342 family)